MVLGFLFVFFLCVVCCCCCCCSLCLVCACLCCRCVSVIVFVLFVSSVVAVCFCCVLCLVLFVYRLSIGGYAWLRCVVFGCFVFCLANSYTICLLGLIGVFVWGGMCLYARVVFVGVICIVLLCDACCCCCCV